MKFYLTTSLEPEIYLLAGKIYVKASGKSEVERGFCLNPVLYIVL